ncbi:MAG: ABC transporter ATP-binding protein [Chromatiales bacterium]
MEDILIAAEGLTRLYGERCAIQDIDVTLRRGEVVGFLGPNGAGKSTTMRILSGVLAPSAGSVHIAGIDLLERPREAKARIGYLPEEPPLYRELRVDEYLRYCARLHRVPAREVGEALRRVKARCGLDDAGDRLIGNLSKGYQQRVGVAQALIHAPAVVILDEPTVGLDPIQIREIRSLIRELAADHGVILSTHILPEVQTVCDRVLVIHLGRIVMDSPLRALPAGAAQWRLTLRRPPAVAELQRLPQVQRVEMLDAQRVLLEGVALDGEELARQAVARGWGLVELTAQGHSLEEIFVQLTCGETAMEATS